MKKTILKNISLFLLFGFVAVLLSSCEKENIFTTKRALLNEKSKEIKKLYSQMPQRNHDYVTKVGDNILRFPTYQHYLQVVDELRDDCELWNNLFDDHYNHENQQQLMDIEDRIGFDEFLPIRVFEEELNIYGTTFFDIQQTLISNWVENEFVGDNPTDPLFIHEFEQALYNQHREICIADTIYQFRYDGVIKIPVQYARQWLNIRNEGYMFLQNVGWINIQDCLPRGTNGESPNKILFTCYKSGILNATDMPQVFTGDSHSTWIVTGKTGFWGDNRLECKLVNYAYHRTKPNGEKVYKKIKRNCSINTIDQTFFKDHYQGFIFQNYINTDFLHTTDTLSTPKNKKTANGHSSVFIWPTQSTNLTSHFKRGVCHGTLLKIHIDGYENNITVNFLPKN